MIKIHSFTFNDFEENTYIVIDDQSNECLIIDPGCNGTAENGQILSYITENGLKPIRLINTHCHIDHILGNNFISRTFGLTLEAHAGEIPVLLSGEKIAQMYGIPYVLSPQIGKFLDESQSVLLGKHEWKILFCPGHSPASICLYHEGSESLIAGDVLFHRSIGRTDLPGGDYDTLINSIRTKLFTLPPNTKVYPGHGIPTTIGEEQQYNPFLNN